MFILLLFSILKTGSKPFVKFVDKIRSCKNNNNINISIFEKYIELNILETTFNVISNTLNFNIKEFHKDILFPDLYLVEPKDGLFLYEDYMDKKGIRMGFTKKDLMNFFPTDMVNVANSFDSHTDKSNRIEHKGEVLNVGEMSNHDRMALLYELPFDKIQNYFNLECIKSQTHASTPTRKLQYPEPFIASASFVHSDIGFIHILHYNYWL
jgi:hypothetical protein